MSLSTTDSLVFKGGVSDADGIGSYYRAPVMEVSFTVTDSDDFTGIVSTFDADGNISGSHPFALTSGELTAEEAGFGTAFATVRAAVEQALKTKIEGIPANSGVTITYS